MTILLGFLPWILFWVALGNASLLLACLIAAVASIALVFLNLRHGARPNILDVGSIVFFVAATIAAALVDAKALEPWMNSFSSWGLVILALVSVLAGHPFVRSYAQRNVSAEVAASGRFKLVTMRLTLVWLATFVVAAIAATIPPLAQPGISLRDLNSIADDLFYWVIPLVAFALAVIITVHTQRQSAGRGAGERA